MAFFGIRVRRLTAGLAVLTMIAAYVLLVGAQEAGAAVFRCGRARATIVGTNGSETIVGTPRRDVIVALGGNDTIRARGGRDIVCAGRGNDLVKGQGGNDDLVGEGGKDRIVGGAGSDLLIGFSGNDILKGGPGRDQIFGMGGRDVLRGGGGNDDLLGGPGNDRLVGQGGHDNLFGENGADTLRGNAGQDYLFGMARDDKLNGGAGPFDIASFLFGGPVNVNLATGIATGQGTDALTSIEIVEGSEGSDVLIGNDGPNFFWTNAGDDTIDGAGGLDGVSMFRSEFPVDVDLAAGTVTLGGSNMSLTSIEQAAGSICCNDTLDGDAGPNELFGFDGNDILNGAGGNDLLNGEEGTDTGDGGDGTDRCISIENPINCELFGPAAAAQMTRALNSQEPAARRALAHPLDGEMVRMPIVGTR